jgi:GAF domain-containing protein
VAWSDARSERLRLKGLTDVSQLLLHLADHRRGESELEVTLREVLKTAVSVTGARYGALGLFDEAGQRLVRFLPLGLDEETIRRIGSWPTGRGLLGAVGQESDVLRVKDLTRHPAFTGFPPGHPVMRSFLGVAIRVRGSALRPVLPHREARGWRILSPGRAGAPDPSCPAGHGT